VVSSLTLRRFLAQSASFFALPASFLVLATLLLVNSAKESRVPTNEGASRRTMT
jgi:hypothetical protein